MMTTILRYRFHLLCVLLVTAGCTLHFVFGHSYAYSSGHALGLDDAYISYRYAENLILGHGLVFNPHERVEGYTNLLYTVLSALILLVAPNHIYPVSFIINTTCYIAAAYVLVSHLGRTVGAELARLGTLAFCLCPILWIWPGSGLEASPVLLIQLAMCVTVASLDADAPGTRFNVLIALMLISVLIRADGFVFPMICTAFLFLRRQYGHALRATLMLALFVGAYIACRISYYGEIWPNTYYAKVSGLLWDRVGAATHQLVKLSIYQGLCLYLLPLFAAVLLWLCGSMRLRRLSLDNVPLFPFAAFSLIAYWLYVGGDNFQERFLIVLVPLGIATLLELKVRGFSRKRRALAVLLVVLLQLGPFMTDRRFDYRKLFDYSLEKNDMWVELGKYLYAAHPSATLAIDAAGKVPFYSKLHTIDMLGLADKHIAHAPVSEFLVGHSKFDPEYVVSQDPTLIAAWRKRDMDLAWGMTEELYSAHGYRLKYVVNSTREPRTHNIIDVREMTSDQIADLMSQGYNYFVLMKSTAGPAGILPELSP